MAKLKFDFTNLLGGVAGGMAAYYVDGMFEEGKKEAAAKNETYYIPSIVQAVAGAAISAFAPQGILKGVGNGMVGAAGYSIATLISNDSTNGAAASGIGALLPSQHAVGALRRGYRPFRSRVSGTETTTTGGQSVVQNVQ
jgi:hypothetical protein